MMNRGRCKYYEKGSFCDEIVATFLENIYLARCDGSLGLLRLLLLSTEEKENRGRFELVV